MQKFRYILKKEFIILVRDIPGLVILFLMPVLLIFVVTLAQETALKNQNARTKILFVDDAGTPFARQLRSNLDSVGFFEVITQSQSIPINKNIAKEFIRNGTYKFGIIIPKEDTGIIVLTDPTMQETYRTSVVNSVTYIIKSVQAKEILMQFIGGMDAGIQPIVSSILNEKLNNLPPVKEIMATKELSAITPNVIQNNVPGFILFAMFFIVIPLAGSIITEKTDGSYKRLRSLPVSMFSVLNGKVITYLVVCLLQFGLMMAIGIWVFPAFFGFPALEIGHQYLALFIATFAAALAAIGFGLIVGAYASNHNQAALFGSVMVVLLGVVSGTFLPIHLMPKAIQYMSLLSPMRWGIDNYLNLFIREGNVLSILPYSFLLLIFFGFAMTSSIVIFAKQT